MAFSREWCLLGNNHHSGKGKAIFLYFEKCDGKLIHRTVRAAAHRTFRARWLLIVIMRLPLAILESPCEVEQVTETAGRVFSRPAVQLGLHLPYLAVGRDLPGRLLT
jgi:hypothetical protein